MVPIGRVRFRDHRSFWLDHYLRFAESSSTWEYAGGCDLVKARKDLGRVPFGHRQMASLWVDD
jgi:hypothetical protein